MPILDMCPADDMPGELVVVYWVSLGVFAIAASITLGMWVYYLRATSAQPAPSQINYGSSAPWTPDAPPTQPRSMFPRGCGPDDDGGAEWAGGAIAMDAGYGEPCAADDPRATFMPPNSISAPRPAAYAVSTEALAFATIIFSLQVVLYVALLMGEGTIFRMDLVACVPWLRWVVYGASCGMLAYEIAKITRMPRPAVITYVIFVVATLLSGALVCTTVLSASNRWRWFGVGFAPYAASLVVLFVFGRGRGWGPPLFVLLTWSFYPAIFVAGPTLSGASSATVEAVLYLVADAITKIGFSVWAIGWGHPAPVG